MAFKLTINTDGAAFRHPYTGDEDYYAEGYEVANLLRKVVTELTDTRRYGSIIDINGNKVGEYRFEEE